MDVPEARRVERPTWVNLRTVVGLVLFCGAVVAGQRVLEGARTTVPMWAAARDLPAATAIGPDDVRVVDANLPAALLPRYLPESASVQGAVLARPVLAGELIPGAALAESAGGPGRLMTVPVAPEHAVGGALRPGDTVDVFATFDAGDQRARTAVVAAGVEVIDVVRGSGLVVEQGGVVGVTLAVTPEQAAHLAHAIRTADVDLARVTSPGVTTVPRSVNSEDLP